MLKLMGKLGKNAVIANDLYSIHSNYRIMIIIDMHITEQ